MKNDIKLVASDIEGTLVDGKGNLRPGVKELISKISDNEIEFALQSGMSLFEIENTLNRLKRETGRIDLEADVIAFGGAYIRLSDGTVLKDQKLTKNELTKVRDIIKDCANGTVIIYRGKEENYREKTMEVETVSAKVKHAGLVVLVGLLEAIKKINLPHVKISKKMLEAKIENNEIYSLEIINTGSKLRKIEEELKKEFGSSVDISVGRTVQFGHGNKLEGIKAVQKKKTGKDDLTGVCSMGDGVNDIGALNATEYAIVTNTKYEKVYNVAKNSIINGSNKKYAVGDFGEQAIKFVTNQEFNASQMAQESGTNGAAKIKHKEPVREA